MRAQRLVLSRKLRLFESIQEYFGKDGDFLAKRSVQKMKTFRMFLPRISYLTFTAAFLLLQLGSYCAAETLELRVTQAMKVLDGAEERFVTPDPQWFEKTRQALSEEAILVSKKLDSHGDSYSAAWKNHLRWQLLTRNLGSPSSINFDELALVRRWLYSNRKGLEYPFFAQLREKTDAHLDAAFAFTRHDLESEFRSHVLTAREQLQEFALEPNDERVAALGRTLGWFDRTHQLADETIKIRSLLSLPNAQVVIAKPLMDRAISLLATKVEQTLPVSDRVAVGKGGLFSRERIANVHGTASTQGQIGLQLEPSSTFADLLLVYTGDIDSRCRALVGPVTVAMRTTGLVRAITPVQVSLQGVQLLSTQVAPNVRTRVTGVSAKNKLVRQLGERRVREPESMQQMNSRARYKASALLQKEIDDRVATALDEIRTELSQAKASLDNLSEVLAPVVREGASPHLLGIESSHKDVTVNAASYRREQLGAAIQFPQESLAADLQVRFHVSFFNNMAETIMAGKTFTDKYFMKYSKVIQPQLPPALMVHARSTRWAIVAAKPRPLEISIPAANQLRIQLRAQRVDIGDEHFTGSTVATIHYVLERNDFDEFELVRQGQVKLDSPLPAASQDFLLQKFNAFFAPVLNGGGVALPEGGTLGKLRSLQPQGVYADRDWLALGVKVPDEFLEAWLPEIGQ